MGWNADYWWVGAIGEAGGKAQSGEDEGLRCDYPSKLNIEHDGFQFGSELDRSYYEKWRVDVVLGVELDITRPIKQQHQKSAIPPCRLNRLADNLGPPSPHPPPFPPPLPAPSAPISLIRLNNKIICISPQTATSHTFPISSCRLGRNVAPMPSRRKYQNSTIGVRIATRRSSK